MTRSEKWMRYEVVKGRIEEHIAYHEAMIEEYRRDVGMQIALSLWAAKKDALLYLYHSIELDQEAITVEARLHGKEDS